MDVCVRGNVRAKVRAVTRNIPATFSCNPKRRRRRRRRRRLVVVAVVVAVVVVVADDKL